MRVGIDVRACLGPGAGMNTYTRELLLSLARTPEVELVMWCAGRRPERLRQLLLPELLALDPAVPLVTRRLSNQLLYSLPALAFWQRWPRLVPPPRVLPRDLDLYHAVFWPLPLDPTIPRVQTIHDLLGLRHAAWATAQMRAEQRTIVALAPRAAWVIVDSEATRADVLDRCRLDPERVTTVPLGVDARFAEPVPPDCLASARERHGLPDRYLVSLATRDPRKNLGRLIDAYDLIVDQLPAGERLDLVLIGAGGWGRDAVAPRLARPRRGRVHITGWIPPDELLTLLAGAAAMAYPSLGEGFGLPPLEAMAAGCPVVTSNISSLPEVVGDAAVTVDPTDVEAIADGLRRVLTDSSLAADLRRRGRARAAQFTWARTARETLAVYQRVLG